MAVREEFLYTNATVLNVNDDPARRYVVSRVLKAAGFGVIEAASGDEALLRAGTERPTVVVLDVKLPDIDGFEVCRRLKATAETASTPILMCSAFLVEDIDKVKGLEHADAYLAEPVPPEILVATVKALVRVAHAEAERAELLAMRRTEAAASALVRVGQRLMATSDAQERADLVVSTLIGVFGVRRVLLLTADANTGLLTCVAAAGDFDGVDPVGRAVAIGTGFAGRVVAERRPGSTPNIREERGIQLPPWMTPLTEPECAAWASVPLIAHDETLGALSLGATTGRHFRLDELHLLEAFGGQAALAIRNARLYDELRASKRRLEVVSRRLLEVQEVEQRRLARELHDEMGAAISALKMQLQAIERRPDLGAAGAEVGGSVVAVDGLLERVRRVSLDLRPSLLDDYGVEAALRWYVDRQARHASLDMRIRSEVGDARFAPETESACFRVAQAAITNAVRHACARHVGVELRRTDDELLLVVRDDGAGFDVALARARARQGESVGLLAMEERATLAGGRLDIESVPGHGTELSARFPLAARRVEDVEASA